MLEKLGSGGMGEVWKAEDTQLRRTVALKFLSSETVGDEEIKARLIREAQASASLDHPNICQVFGIHEERGETFIAMAYIGGPSLADHDRMINLHSAWRRYRAAPVSTSVNDSCTDPAGIPSTLRERGVFQQPWRRPQL